MILHSGRKPLLLVPQEYYQNQKIDLVASGAVSGGLSALITKCAFLSLRMNSLAQESVSAQEVVHTLSSSMWFGVVGGCIAGFALSVAKKIHPIAQGVVRGAMSFAALPAVATIYSVSRETNIWSEGVNFAEKYGPLLVKGGVIGGALSTLYHIWCRPKADVCPNRVKNRQH